MGQGYADLSAIEITILDEADHMADLGFLPGVRRIMDKTPQSGQRMLFSATLDKAIDVLVKRFLTNAVTHEADSAQSPVSTMHHHVLHLSREQRVPVLVDLTSAPGRTVVFTRTKHGAKALARQLNKSGVPTVDLHGNLSQNARTRNMEAFHSGDRHDAGRDRHRRARHPRRRRGARDPRRPADRAQGLPAPLGPYGSRGQRGHRHHADDRRAAARRARPDPAGRHQADHHQGQRPRPRDARAARPRRAQPARRPRRRGPGLDRRWRPRSLDRRQRPAQAGPQHRPDQRPVASGQPDVVHQRDARLRRPAPRVAASAVAPAAARAAARVAARARAVAATVVVAPVAAASPPAPRPAVARTARRRSAAVADAATSPSRLAPAPHAGSGASAFHAGMSEAPCWWFTLQPPRRSDD